MYFGAAMMTNKSLVCIICCATCTSFQPGQIKIRIIIEFDE